MVWGGPADFWLFKGGLGTVSQGIVRNDLSGVSVSTIRCAAEVPGYSLMSRHRAGA